MELRKGCRCGPNLAKSTWISRKKPMTGKCHHVITSVAVYTSLSLHLSVSADVCIHIYICMYPITAHPIPCHPTYLAYPAYHTFPILAYPSLFCLSTLSSESISNLILSNPIQPVPMESIYPNLTECNLIYLYNLPIYILYIYKV